MKNLLLLALLLATTAPADALPHAAYASDPNAHMKMRRHLRHQAKMRLRQYRHR